MRDRQLSGDSVLVVEWNPRPPWEPARLRSHSSSAVVGRSFICTVTTDTRVSDCWWIAELGDRVSDRQGKQRSPWTRRRVR
jgi:hypothetical protein